MNTGQINKANIGYANITANSSSHNFNSTEGGIFSGKGVLGDPFSLFLVQVSVITLISRLRARPRLRARALKREIVILSFFCKNMFNRKFYLVIIMALCRIIHFFLTRIRQPSVIAEVIGGMCLGPSILGNIPGFTNTIFPPSSLANLNVVANIGLVLYMFLMGLELNTSSMFRGIRRFFFISIAGIIVPGLLGAAVSFGLYEVLLEPERQKDTPFFSFLLFTFVSMAITAFPVLARILTEKKLLSTTVGLMSISAAAIDDICAWILLALVISIVNASSPATAVYVLCSVAGFALIMVIPMRILLVKIYVRFFSNRTNVLTPLVLAAIFILLFISAWITQWIGVHAIFGAFLAGIVIPRRGSLIMELTHKIEDLVLVVFLPLYFASSGLKTQLGLLNDWRIWCFLVLVIVVACVGKIVGCTLAAWCSGFQWRESLSIGILMNTKGLVELIVLNIGLDSGVINARIFALMVLMALVTTFMTSPLIAWIYPKKYQTEATDTIPPSGKKKRTIVLNRIDEDNRLLVYLHDIDSIPLLAGILQMFMANLEPGKKLFLNGIKAFTDFDRSSNIMASTQSDSVIESNPTLKMFRFFGNIIGAQTKSFVTHTRLLEIGDEIDQIANREQCEFIIVSWQTDIISTDQLQITNSILNIAQTIGIYVDRMKNKYIEKNVSFRYHDSMSPHLPLPNLAFNGILVLFIGGINDRAAVQLAFRLRRHTNIRLMPLPKLDTDILQAAKSLSKEENFSFHAVPIRGGDYTPGILLLNSPYPQVYTRKHRFLIGQTFGYKKLSIVRNSKQLIDDANNNKLFTTRNMPRSNQRIDVQDEEKIFGFIGSMIYSDSCVTSSLLIVHANGSHTHLANEEA